MLSREWTAPRFDDPLEEMQQYPTSLAQVATLLSCFAKHCRHLLIASDSHWPQPSARVRYETPRDAEIGWIDSHQWE